MSKRRNESKDAKSDAAKTAAGKAKKAGKAAAAPKRAGASKGSKSSKASGGKSARKSGAPPKAKGTSIRIGTGRREGASFKLRKAKGWGKVRGFRLAHLLFDHDGEDIEIVPLSQKLEFFDEVNGKELHVEFEGEITIADKAVAKALKSAENGTDYVLEVIADGKELESGVDFELKENRNLWVG